MEIAIYSDYEPGREPKRKPKDSGGSEPTFSIPSKAVGLGPSKRELGQKETSGCWGLVAGESVMVRVYHRLPPNPRMLICILRAPDGVERRILLKVGRNQKFRPGMELEVKVPECGQESEPWEYTGPMPRLRGIW